jgi:hypothetical protein
VAWLGGCVGHLGYESGAAGFPAVVGLLGCAQLVASGDGWTDDDLV